MSYKYRRGQLKGASNKMVRCGGCGRPCHSSLDGMRGINLCRTCLDDSMAENTHNDHHDTFVEGCKFCVADNTLKGTANE